MHFDSSYLAVIVDLSAYCIVIPSSPEPEQWAPALKTNAHLRIFVFYPSEAYVENRIHFHFPLSTDIAVHAAVQQLLSSTPQVAASQGLANWYISGMVFQ